MVKASRAASKIQGPGPHTHFHLTQATTTLNDLQTALQRGPLNVATTPSAAHLLVNKDDLNAILVACIPETKGLLATHPTLADVATALAAANAAPSNGQATQPGAQTLIAMAAVAPNVVIPNASPTNIWFGTYHTNAAAAKALLTQHLWQLMYSMMPQPAAAALVVAPPVPHPALLGLGAAIPAAGIPAPPLPLVAAAPPPGAPAALPAGLQVGAPPPAPPVAAVNAAGLPAAPPLAAAPAAAVIAAAPLPLVAAAPPPGAPAALLAGAIAAPPIAVGAPPPAPPVAAVNAAVLPPAVHAAGIAAAPLPAAPPAAAFAAPRQGAAAGGAANAAQQAFNEVLVTSLVSIADVLKGLKDAADRPHQVSKASPDMERQIFATRTVQRARDDAAPAPPLTAETLIAVMHRQQTLNACGNSGAFPPAPIFARFHPMNKTLDQEQLGAVHRRSIAVASASAAVKEALDNRKSNEVVDMLLYHTFAVVLDAFEPFLDHVISEDTHHGFANNASEICAWFKHDKQVYAALWDPSDMDDGEAKAAIALCLKVDAKIVKTKATLLKTSTAAAASVKKFEKALAQDKKRQRGKPRGSSWTAKPHGSQTVKPRNATTWCGQCAANGRHVEICKSHNNEGTDCADDKARRMAQKRQRR